MKFSKNMLKYIRCQKNTASISTIKYFAKLREYYFNLFLYFFHLFVLFPVVITQKLCYSNIDG